MHLEDGGTLTSVFMLWNTFGVFIYGTLGVHAYLHAPYAILNFEVSIFYYFSITGVTIAKIKQSGEESVEI